MASEPEPVSPTSSNPSHVTTHQARSREIASLACTPCPQSLRLLANDEAKEVPAAIMGPRITTWNVNGIRNPFNYQPWRDRRTYDGMFEVLEADIVIMQELKIQRKDLTDEMVLVPGWDCFFSLPKHKKG